MTFDIKRALTASIEATNDPLTPIKIQAAFSAATQLGQLLTPLSSEQAVHRVTKRLLKDFTDAELDVANPALIIALSALLTEATIRLGSHYGSSRQPPKRK